MAKEYSLSFVFKLIDKATAPMRKLGKNIGKLTSPWGRVKDAVRRMAMDRSWMNIRKQVRNIGTAIGQMSRRAISNLRKLGSGMKKVGTSIQDAGRKLTMMTLPISIFGGLTVRTAISFQERMNMVRAVTKATGKQFNNLKNLAKEMGATTQFSASQAAEAMQFMGMSGMSTGEIMKGLPRVLELAAAAQLDMGSAADIVTNVMRGYGKDVEELKDVNDVLVNAFTSANVNLQMLGESFKYAGPIAKGAGLDFETTTALIAKMGDAGIQGSMAGTAMRGMLLRLQNPTRRASVLMKRLGMEMRKSGDKTTKEGAKGVFDLVGAIEQMEKSGATAAQIAKMVGDRAGPALAVLVQTGTKSLEEFIEKLKEEGSAARVAEDQMKGLPGAFKSLASAIEAVQLALMDTDFGKGMEEVVKYLADILRHLSKANPELLSFIAGFGAFLISLGPILIAIGTLVKLKGILLLGFTAIKGAVIAVSAAFSSFVVPVGLVVGAILLMIKAFKMVSKNWDMIKLGLWELKEMFLEAFLNPIDLIKENWEYIIPWFGSLWETLKVGISEFGEFLKETILNPIKTIRTMFPGFLKFGAGKPVKEGVGGTKSQADVNIKLIAEPGTEARVEQVKKTKGDINLNLATAGYVGNTM